MTPYTIEPLDKHHDRKTFDCGVKELNGYLQTTAFQHSKKGISRTFVIVEHVAPPVILGFITLTACEIVSERLPTSYSKKFPTKVSGAKVGRLAVSSKYKRIGIGRRLLVFAMEQAVIVHKSFGLTGMLVDAKDDRAMDYYKQFGFISLPDHPHTLFLPMQTIIQAFQP
jgi:ribosomal protein S18 acetylase RimI-like enzyme